MKSDPQQMIFQYGMVILLGLGIIIGLLIWVSKIIKKNPGSTFGDIANAMFMREKLSIFIITCVLINFGEALMAASITPEGEVAVNPLARIISHMIIAIAGISCGLSLPTSFFNLFEKETKYRAWHVIMFIGAVFGTFYLPYVNLMLIANGLKETLLLQLFIMDRFPWNDMVPVFKQLGQKPHFSPWNNMSYPMATSVAVTGVHFFLVVLDGCHIVLKNKVDALKSKDEKKKEEKGGSSYKDAGDPITRMFKYLSNGVYNTAEEEKYVRLAHRAHDGMGQQAKSKVSSKNASMIDSINRYDKEFSKYSAKEAEEKKTDLRKSIMDFMQDSISDGKGYGLTLPKIDFANNTREKKNPN